MTPHDAATYPSAQFRFRPGPCDLRHAAEAAVRVASGQIILLQRILDAQPADERTPEELVTCSLGFESSRAACGPWTRARSARAST